MRKLAEWVSFLLSALLILALVAYLIYEMIQPQSQYIRFRFTPEIHSARREGDLFVLPIKVKNLNDQSVNQLEFSVTVEGSQPKETSIEVKIDYLGGQSTETVYVFLKRDPGLSPIRVQPSQYRVQ